MQPGGSEDTLLERLFSYYGPDQGDNKGHALLLKSDKPHHFLLGHSHGTDWVEYDAQGWLSHAKQNPASQNAATLLQDSQKYAFNSLIVLHSSTLQRKYTYLFVSLALSLSLLLLSLLPIYPPSPSSLCQAQRSWSMRALHGTRTALCAMAVRSPSVPSPSFQTKTTTTVYRATRAGSPRDAATAKR